MADPRTQRKRRQNVACDSCKLRRVKCDLTALLIPEGQGDDVDGDDNPPSLLKQLVQQHPEVVCTPCKNKRIPCTTESIRNPLKPTKGGKRITLARQLFGKDEDAEGSSEELEAVVPEAGPSRTTNPPDLMSLLGTSVFPHQAFQTPQLSTYSQQDEKSRFDFSSSSVTPAAIDTLEVDRYHDEQNAFRIWRDASDNLTTITAKAPPLPLLPSPTSEDLRATHGGKEMIQVDIEPTMNWIKGRPLYSTTIGGRAADQVLPYFGTGNSRRTAGMGWSSLEVGRGSVVTQSPPEAGSSARKRRMGNDGTAVTIHDEREPWHLWSESNEIVSWGRREVVQESLADRALGQALSRHLVTIYFNVVHLAFPAVSPEAFYVEWLRSGQRSDRMSPSQETLCAVIEAWGARFSDSPIVLGLTGSKSGHAPKVWKRDGTTIPGTVARIHWGRSRLSACNALADRAKRLIDINGIMRRPTVTGIQALALYNLLTTMTDQADRAADQYMQSVMSHSAVVEGMRLLQLMWDSDGQMDMDETELPCENPVLRMKQRRIFWSAMVSDALWAAGAAQMPKIPASDIEAAAKWLNVVDRQLPNSSIKVLACFMRFYHRIVWVARDIAVHVSIPSRRPGSIDVASFCKTIRKLWVELKTLRRDIVVDCAATMERCDHALAGVSPLTHLTSLRLSVPFLLLILHQHIQAQLDFRRTLKSAFIVEDSAPRPDQVNMAKLEELHLQSVDVVLQSCRAHVPMFKILIPLGIMQTATSFLRDIIATALFMAEVPTIEQGYPSHTLGGHGWTWETKQEEVGICVQAINQLGWAWSDCGAVLEAVMLTMERMTPTQETLDAYYNTSPPGNQLIDTKLREEANEDVRVMDQALVFWPPDSVPALVEKAMEGIDVQTAPPAELSRRLAPDSMYARSIARDRRPHRRLNAESLAAGGLAAVDTPNTDHSDGSRHSYPLNTSASPFNNAGTSVSPFNAGAFNQPPNHVPGSESTLRNTPESVFSSTVSSRPDSRGQPFGPGFDPNFWTSLSTPFNGQMQSQVSNASSGTDPTGFSTPFDYLFNTSPSRLFSSNADVLHASRAQPQGPLFPIPNAGPSGTLLSSSVPLYAGAADPTQSLPLYNPDYPTAANQIPNFDSTSSDQQSVPTPTPSLWGFDFGFSQHQPQGPYLSEQSGSPVNPQNDSTGSGYNSGIGSRSGSNEPVVQPTFAQASWSQTIQPTADPSLSTLNAGLSINNPILASSNPSVSSTNPSMPGVNPEPDYAELQQFLHDLEYLTVPGQPGSVPS